MKTKHPAQIFWHLLLICMVCITLTPILFAISNSFKTLQDAFNTVFELIPSNPTLENYRLHKLQ